MLTGCKHGCGWEDWRDVPLLTALSYGVASVEADVYLINGTLFVSGWHSVANVSHTTT